MIKSCKNCDHRVYDPQWGEPICKVYNHRVHDVDKYLDCREHKEKDVKEVTRDE